MNKMLGSKKYIILFVMPALFIFVCFTIGPLITSGIYSLFDYDGIGKMDFAGLENYIKAITDDRHFLGAVKNSWILALASILIQLPVALFLALILARGVKGEKYFRTIYFVPVVISSMVIGQLWMKIFHSEYGLLNIFIGMFTKEPFEFSWLTDPRTAFLCTVIPSVWQFVGYHMLIFYAGIKSISTDYYEAARIDGADHKQISFRIIIPLLAPVIKTCMIFALTGSLRAFDLIYVITGGGPNHVSEVPATLMYSNLFRKGLYGYGSAQAFFIVIECVILSAIIGKLFRQAEENASAI